VLNAGSPQRSTESQHSAQRSVTTVLNAGSPQRTAEGHHSAERSVTTAFNAASLHNRESPQCSTQRHHSAQRRVNTVLDAESPQSSTQGHHSAQRRVRDRLSHHSIRCVLSSVSSLRPGAHQPGLLPGAEPIVVLHVRDKYDLVLYFRTGGDRLGSSPAKMLDYCERFFLSAGLLLVR